jgi:DNA-binding CsgD family transcriptional regulator
LQTRSIDPAVEDLLRRILERVGADALFRPPNGELAADEVVLDVSLDGRRYLLVREPAAAPAKASLSPREKEIVRLVAKGLPNKAIAEVLDISLWTVATYLRRLFAKVAVSSRAELIARVYDEGLLV